MKTQFNQIVTIVGFFSVSMGATLAISWAMSQMLNDKVTDQSASQEIFLIKTHPKVNINLLKPLKMLLPKSSPTGGR